MEKFKCVCGNNMFHQGKHHNVIMCAKCSEMYEDQKPIKLDYYGSQYERKITVDVSRMKLEKALEEVEG